MIGRSEGAAARRLAQRVQCFVSRDAELGKERCDADRALLAAQRQGASERIQLPGVDLRNRRGSEPGLQRLARRTPAERMASGQELIGDACQAVDVVARIRRRKRVRRDVLHEEWRHPRRGRGQQVEHFDRPILCDENGLETNVAVDRAFRVRVFECITDAAKHRERLGRRRQIALHVVEQRSKRDSLEQLRHEEVLAAVAAESAHLHDVRMRPEVRLLVARLELPEQARLLRNVPMQQVQRDAVLEPELQIGKRAVDGLVDLPETPAAEARRQRVTARDDAADRPAAVGDPRRGFALVEAAREASRVRAGFRVGVAAIVEVRFVAHDRCVKPSMRPYTGMCRADSVNRSSFSDIHRAAVLRCSRARSP